MKNLVDHLNNYQKDYDNILSMKELGKRYNVELQTYGIIFLDIKNVKVYLKTNEKRIFKNFHLYIFEEVIIAFELVKATEFVRDDKGELVRDMFGAAKKRTVKKHETRGTFKFKDGYEIKSKEGDLSIELNTYDDALKLRKEKSLELMFTSKEDFLRTLGKIKELHKRAKKLGEVEPGSDHIDHKFEIFRNEITEKSTDEDSFKCSECQNYLGGKIWTAVHCFDCDQYFHINCFELEKDEEEEDFPEENLDSYSVLKENEYFVGEIKNDDAKRMLKDKKIGTFLVRFSSNKDRYFLQKKTKDSNNHVTPIYKVPKKELYYINEGFSFNSILEMLKKDHTLKGLDYPVNSPLALKSALQRDLSYAVSVNSLNHENEEKEEEEEEDIELLHYNHGKISAEDTEARLWGKPKGTFLIR